MTMFKRIGVILLAAIVYAFCLELGERFEIRGVHGFVSTAQAIVGRPMTPMSVAGVAHRHYWRAANGYGAGWAAGPWDYYGGSPCNYERTIGGYYRGAGWDRYWLCGPGAYYGGGPW